MGNSGGHSIVKNEGKFSKKTRPTVSVIIPTLNEAKNLPLVLPFLPKDWIDEVILVDGRSTDNTVEVAKQLLPSIKVVLEPKKGKGVAMRAGYRASSGDILIVLDADGSNDPREIPRFILPLLEGADFVKGSRFAPGGGTTDMPRIRKWGNGGLMTLSNILFGMKFTDLAYGYHAFWRYSLDLLDIDEFNGFEIDTALYLQAVRSRLKIVEVPSFEGYRFYGVGKLQTIPDGFRVLRTILKEWINSLRKKEPDFHIGFRGAKLTSVRKPTPRRIQARDEGTQIDLQFLRMLGMMMIAGVDMRYVLQRVLMVTLRALNAMSGSLVLLEDDGSVREGCMAYNGEVDMDYSDTWSEVLQQGLAGWVVKNRKPALVPDTLEDPRWLQRSWEEEPDYSRSALVIPLMAREKVFGVLTLTRSQTKQFTEDELVMLQEYTMSV